MSKLKTLPVGVGLAANIEVIVFAICFYFLELHSDLFNFDLMVHENGMSVPIFPDACVESCAGKLI